MKPAFPILSDLRKKVTAKPALSCLLAAQFELARDKPEYLEFCYVLQVQSCKLDTGHLEPALSLIVLVSLCWLDYLSSILSPWK